MVVERPSAKAESKEAGRFYPSKGSRTLRSADGLREGLSTSRHGGLRVRPSPGMSGLLGDQDAPQYFAHTPHLSHDERAPSEADLLHIVYVPALVCSNSIATSSALLVPSWPWNCYNLNYPLSSNIRGKTIPAT